MATPTSKAHIAAIDESTEGAATLTGGGSFGGIIDESALSEELLKLRNPNRPSVAGNPNREQMHPFQAHWRSVLEEAGVPSRRLTRELASNVCGAVALLPLVPSKDPDTADASGKTEFDQQVDRVAAWAEAEINASRPGNAQMVLTGPARKIATIALERRLEDPDGSLGRAWVNDPLPDDVEVSEAA